MPLSHMELLPRLEEVLGYQPAVILTSLQVGLQGSMWTGSRVEADA